MGRYGVIVCGVRLGWEKIVLPVLIFTTDRL